MRVAVVGTSGSGKSTFAARLAQATGIARIELDEINWRPGWHDRSKRETTKFVSDVEAAIAAPHWVCAGAYSIVRPAIWRRATHVVWLDLPRSLVMRQVLRRSIERAVTGSDVFPGCKENWSKLLTAEHPIRWAWTTHARRRTQFSAMIADPAYAHLETVRCRTRPEVRAALDRLTRRFVSTRGENAQER